MWVELADGGFDLKQFFGISDDELGADDGLGGGFGGGGLCVRGFDALFL